MWHNRSVRRRRVRGGLLTIVVALLALAPAAEAGEEKLRAVKDYPGLTTFSCRTDAITVYPGQNLNDFGGVRTCPNAEKISGPADASVFDRGSSAEGYITRFKPSMVEIKPSGRLVTPAVYDLHLHHVVWLAPNQGPVFAAGEEKTIPKLPRGYGFKVGGDANWAINQMIHNLTASEGRQVYITWEIDWVPETDPARNDIRPVSIRWMDVAGFPQIYPVFDAERGFDADGDGKYTFPEEVPTDPSAPGYEEREKISRSGTWRVPNGGATLVFGAGHLHPGGLYVDLEVARDGPDPGSADGDDPAEVKRLFRSRARYYEPAGAVSWDVSLQATRPDWRVRLKAGDTVSIDATYDVRKASWYESMGILPLAWSRAADPAAKDPFDDAAAVRRMYKAGGILTHGRLKENIDAEARRDLRLPDPRKLSSRRKRVPRSGVDINSFVYSPGGYSAVPGFPTRLMRPPLVRSRGTVTFNNLDAQEGTPQTEQAWHSITSCKAPCNRGSGIGYPLADGPVKFDSGQLGFGQGTSQEVTTGTESWTTPKLRPPGKKARKRARRRGFKPGKTFTYFCRIHPFMRGSVRVKPPSSGRPRNAG